MKLTLKAISESAFPSAPAFLLMMLVCSGLFADESQTKSGATNIKNIGFMDNPSPKLRERFPMCDAFLDVTWLSKEKKIGYAHYDTLITEKGEFRGKTISVTALVTLQDFESISYDISFYEKHGGLDQVFDLVKCGTIDGVLPMVISCGREVMSFDPGLLVHENVVVQPLLSDHQQSVCVVHPNEKKAWIAEGRTVERTYSPEQAAHLYTRLLSESASKATSTAFAEYWLLDINRDGKEDYVSMSSIYFSLREKYSDVQINYSENGGGKLYFHSGKTCVPKMEQELLPPTEQITTSTLVT